MKFSRITFEVPQDRVEVIVGLLIREVQNFQVAEVHHEKRANTDSSFVTVNGKARSHKFGAAALKVLETIQTDTTKEWFYKDLQGALPQFGMRETSISPILSELNRAGKVARVRRGYYKAV